MAKTTELISFLKDKSEDPYLAVCYARGSVFRPEGKFFRVEKGKRTLVPRVLCVLHHYGPRCRSCPNAEFTVTFRSKGPRTCSTSTI